MEDAKIIEPILVTLLVSLKLTHGMIHDAKVRGMVLIRGESWEYWPEVESFDCPVEACNPTPEDIAMMKGMLMHAALARYERVKYPA